MSSMEVTGFILFLCLFNHADFFRLKANPVHNMVIKPPSKTFLNDLFPGPIQLQSAAHIDPDARKNMVCNLFKNIFKIQGN